MGKIAFIIVNFLFLLGYNIYFGGEVTADQKIPSDVLRGEKFTIEVMINKGDREGFAKWQQEIPDGFIASPIETQGATFSFKKQNVKLIWMALPEEENFTISYEIIPEPTVEGVFSFEGKFSYIEENERKDIISVSEEIKIGSSDVLANKEEEKEESIEELIDNNETLEEEVEPKKMEEESVIAVASVETDKNIEDNKEEIIAEDIEDNLISKKQVTNQEGVSIERKILNLGNGNYEVKLKVSKGKNEGFGKIEEYIPPGYIAMEKSNMDGMFSFNDNVMKILWMALPEENEINISYLMQSEGDELDSATIHGVFSILIADESYQLAMGPSKFKNYFVSNTEEMIAASTEDIAEEIVETEIVEEIDIEEPRKQEIIKEITNIPSPETGITYKVQIAAGKNEVNQNYFVSRHKINEPVSAEYHNSWFKYTVGNYSMYKEARDKRNKVWSADNKIDDAFVTAYNSGERISVQEALMISNQKWVK